ncbi:MAG: hypothetical protein HFH94_05160 [Lachnospiraceae bacterium]|nr:hypothetical protein [uncultured Acetatifactor sp.]MCI9219111.1 hypothetical protein [Lachnospiraceae bacterium]
MQKMSGKSRTKTPPRSTAVNAVLLVGMGLGSFLFSFFGGYGQYILSFCYLQGQIAWGGNFSKLTAEAEIVSASF